MRSRTGQHKGNDTERISKPMFSIIITTRNRAQLLKRALDSLILQTENDWEAIVVDDGSTDDTYTQILSRLRSCPKMEYIWKPHSGPVRSKNYGINVSTGKFVTFLDSDDEYHPVHLESRKEFLIENPSVSFLYGGVKIIGNQYVPDKDNPSVRIHLSDCVIGGSFIIEREVLISLNGFRDIILGSDSDFFSRAKKAQINMAETEVPTYIYHRENQDSLTNQSYLKVTEPY
ncbi:MAG: glycosyltransferase family 2 protein [Bacteroidales bacterium]|nr:glycosyltransferase family 2 protein [Bacteroidales bacterium]